MAISTIDISHNIAEKEHKMINELSIIIPTLNEEYFLPKLLQSISTQNFAGKLQVIVVDGQSQDKTIFIASKFSTKIKDLEIINTERGLPFQRNFGAKRARYKYLLFLDSDVILPTNFLNKLTNKTDPKENKFINFVLHIPTTTDFFDYLFIICVFSFMAIRRMFGEPLIGGSFMYTTKVNHQQIKGFRVGAVIGEDFDYLRRSIKNGAKYHFYYIPFIWASPRRLRKEGRINLLIKWFRCYLYIKKTNKPIYNEKVFTYKYGHYKGEIN